MTARIVFRISVVVLLVYSALTQKCLASGRSESSIIGWMLRGHVYDTLLAELPFTCIFKCREDNRCQSFNWVISLLTCEFNNRTKEARPEDFIPNPERSYYPRDLKRGEPAYQGRGGGETPYNGLYGEGPTGRGRSYISPELSSWTFRLKSVFWRKLKTDAQMSINSKGGSSNSLYADVVLFFFSVFSKTSARPRAKRSRKKGK